MRKDLEARTYIREECVVFRKTKELFGGLSNMAGGFYLKVNGTRIFTSEALYQACRFPHRPEIQRLIVQQASPMTAKMKSKPHRKDSRPDWDAVRIKIMRWCLRVKLVQNWPEFGRLLLATGDRPIVEESRKDDFWGAKAVDDKALIGANVLGRLLMELREDLKGPNSESLRNVLPLDIPNFLLFDKPINIVEERDSIATPVVFSTPLDLFSKVESESEIIQSEEKVSSPIIEENPLLIHPTEWSSELTKRSRTPMKQKKKLIEVALPLDAINKACVDEGSPFTPRHPRSLHVWWARRRLAVARAVIFAQMVDDPSEYTETLLNDSPKKRTAILELSKRKRIWENSKTQYEKDEKACHPGNSSVSDPGPEPTLQDCVADIERERLFGLIEELVKWENTTNNKVIQQAKDEIWQSWRRACADNADNLELFDRYKLPAFYDPFAGGGALPLEAQRLGLEVYASDLNPVAVLINKAMIEIPPKFADKPPVNPEWQKLPEEQKALRTWKGAQGLADDVRYYGKWMRDEAEKRIGYLYPKIKITHEMTQDRPDLEPYVCKELTVISWLWARTVKSPNPAFSNVDVPLISTFMLSTKAGKEAYVEPVIEEGGYHFSVKVGKPKDLEVMKKGTKLARANFFCLMSGTPISGDYIKSEGKAGRVGERLMAVVAADEGGRIYLPPTDEMETVAYQATPQWKPEGEVPERLTGGTCVPYGLEHWGDLFTSRQLVALTTFSDLVQEVRERVIHDALASNLVDSTSPAIECIDLTAHADAIGLYLALAISRWTDLFCSLSAWNSTNQNIKNLFSRQAIPMVWDFAESNPFGIGASFSSIIETIFKLFVSLPAKPTGQALQRDARVQSMTDNKVVSTDPPYYDNIAYADLSDFFYVWLRRALKTVFPDLFSTLTVPKAEELIASPNRHGSKEKAESFFLDGMTQAMHRLAEQAHPAFPVTIYYAFKQSESGGLNETANTGWETFLDAIINAGFVITGTWPVRTERTEALKKRINVLASSIVLVCRPRFWESPNATRGEFIAALKTELAVALTHLQHANIAPVDLAQAAIGPGMAVYTRYAKVLDAGGKPLTVRDALALINQTLDEILTEQEGDFDADSRWALVWFEQSGFAEGEFGAAETLSKAKNTSIPGMAEAGILASSHGKVRLLRPDELPMDWEPEADKRLTAWEMVHQLVRALESGGEDAAATLVAKLGSKAEIARELAYRLYTLCERKKRSAEALSYNGLVRSWSEIIRLSRETGKILKAQRWQAEMFDEEERK